MSPLLRGGLAVAGLAGAFAAGFFLKPKPTIAEAAKPVVVVAPANPTAGKPVSSWAPGTTPVAPAVAIKPLPTIEDIRLPDLPNVPPGPATVLGPPAAARPEPIDPSDPAFQLIKKQLGIKTTVLDKSEPPPLVLTEARKEPVPPAVDLTPPAMPMEGPVPRLEPPPVRDELVLPPTHAVPKGSAVARLVNTRDVALDFEVTKTGTSKVTAVELWTTRDGGATWAKTDRMAGAQSPFRTRLSSEGDYGFRLVFESESGMRTPEPKRNDTPNLFLELDLTPPSITIYPPEAIEGEPGKVRLRWQMTDRHPDPRARLEYSEDGIAWQPVGGQDLPKVVIGGGGSEAITGSYDWTPPPGVPPRVLLRVTTRDQAGNSATVATNHKAVIDLVPPEGRLTGVRTPSPEPEVGPMPRDLSGRASTLPSPIPEVLRPILPVVLGSPTFAGGAIEMSASDGRPGAIEAARAWLRQVTETDLGVTPKPISAWDIGCLVDLLRDRDWKPSTALPDSYRPWEFDRLAPQKFFDGVIYVVVPADLPPGPWVARAGQ